MPLVQTTWCSPEEAASKFGLELNRVLKWVEEGVVRAEQDGKKVLRVHLDDIELKVRDMTGL